VELFSRPEYVHVLINHLPLTGLFAALLCLIGALITRKRAAIFLGLGLVSLFSFSAWPVYVYGEEGYDRVYSMADEDGDAYLQRHKELAERWIWLFYATGALAAGGVVAGWRWAKCLWPTGAGVAILAAISLVAGAVVADYGGKVRHREFRKGRPPALHSDAGIHALIASYAMADLFDGIRQPDDLVGSMRWERTCGRPIRRRFVLPVCGRKQLSLGAQPVSQIVVCTICPRHGQVS